MLHISKGLLVQKSHIKNLKLDIRNNQKRLFFHDDPYPLHGEAICDQSSEGESPG